MKFNIPRDFDMKKLLSNLDWSFETSEYEILHQSNNDFYFVKHCNASHININKLYTYITILGWTNGSNPKPVPLPAHRMARLCPTRSLSEPKQVHRAANYIAILMKKNPARKNLIGVNRLSPLSDKKPSNRTPVNTFVLHTASVLNLCLSWLSKARSEGSMTHLSGTVLNSCFNHIVSDFLKNQYGTQR
jgi:hypothetical protein